MDNFISKLNPNELVISLYHPKLYHLYQKFGTVLDKLVYPTFDANTKKLYDHLKDIEKGLSLEGFKLKCDSLGFSEDMNLFLSETYSRYCGLEDDDYKSLFYRIRNYVLNEAIKDAVNKYNTDHEADAFIERISNYQISDLNNNFNDEKLFSTFNFEDIDVNEVKEDYVQGVIKSSLSIINEATTLGGFMRGQMVVFGAPTKCFTGDTRLLTGNGKSDTLEEIYNSGKNGIKIYSVKPDGRPYMEVASHVQLSKYVDEIAEVNIEGTIIKCTVDHPFYTIRGIVKAKDLTSNDTLLTVRKGFSFITDARSMFNQKVNYVNIKKLESEIPVYGVVDAGTYHNYAILTDEKEGVGVFVGNTGKSMIAMQEAVNFLKQDLNVVYSAFGDLKQYDFLYRMSSQINNRPLPFTELNLISEVESAKNKVKQLTDGHLNIQLLAPDKFTATDYVDYMKNSYAKDGKTKLHDWADVIIVDYDANLRSDKSMYLKGEDIYQTLYQLTYPDKLLIVLAQTNKFSWGKEIIGLGELGESSRKQQIVDILLTISHPISYNVQNHVGWMNLCAGRRVSLMKCPYFRDVDGTFHEINSDTYGLIKSSSDLKTFIKDIDIYNNYLTGNYSIMKDSGSVEYSESVEDSSEVKDGDS